jgi:hypothetical protein
MGAESEFPDVDVERLSELFEIDESCGWSDSDEAAIFRHQLLASLQHDLRPAEADGAKTGQRETTFRDLFCDPDPNMELLQRVKEFSKTGNGADSVSLPGSVAGLLYLLAISAALVRLDVRISTHSDAALLSRLKWAISLPWVDAELRTLLRQAQQQLNSE